MMNWPARVAMVRYRPLSLLDGKPKPGAGGDQSGGGNTDQEGHLPACGQIGGSIGADTEESAMPQRNLAGVTDKDI